MAINRFPVIRLSRFLAFVGVAMITVLVLSLVILLTEFFYGNGDGVWYDVDVRRMTFNFLVTTAFASLVLLALFYAPGAVRSTTSTVLFSLVLLFLIEKACKLIITLKTPLQTGQGKSRPFERPDWRESVMRDDLLGVKAKPNWTFDFTPTRDGIVYDTVHISTDQYSRRVTPFADTTVRSRFALFLGCSYTYGDGVSDNQTLPYYFQKEAIDYQAYNYGFLGYSPLHTLAHLQHTKLEEQMTQKAGFGVFTMINDHLDRVIPASRWIEITRGRFPYLDPKTMRTEGTFDQKRKLYTVFVENFQTTGLKEMLKWGYPRHHTPEHEEWMAKIVIKARDEYVARFKNDDFYVIIFPGNPASTTIQKAFKSAGIKYFDYTNLIDMKTHMLGFDEAHPNAQVYEVVAKQFARDIHARLRHD